MYMHDKMAKSSNLPGERNLLDECVCQQVRTAARAVTRAYDDALRAAGLRATQLSVLVGAAREDAVSIASLSRRLGMDRSTLTRNLRPLEEDGLVTVGSEGWHRSRTLVITKKGKARLRAAFPLWEKVQRGLCQTLGESRWLALRAELVHLGQTAEELRPAGRIR